MVWLKRAAAALPLLLMLAPGEVRAQVPQSGDSITSALERLSARLDTLQSGDCPRSPAVRVPALPAGHDVSLDSLAAAVQRLGDRLETAIAQRCAVGAAPPAGGPPADSTAGDLAALRAAAAAAAGAQPAGG